MKNVSDDTHANDYHRVNIIQCLFHVDMVRSVFQVRGGRGGVCGGGLAWLGGVRGRGHACHAHPLGYGQ